MMDTPSVSARGTCSRLRGIDARSGHRTVRQLPDCMERVRRFVLRQGVCAAALHGYTMHMTQ
jgi:hypothetical protein